ncbi:MAG: ATP-binding cassette domain-containing protein [Candidatus Omnitrophota bacterium]
MALISLQDITIAFGSAPVLDNATLQVERGERVCLIGRNGSGKTTLMKLIDGELEPDHGLIIRQQGFKSAILTQEIPVHIGGTVFDVVSGGIPSHEKVNHWDADRRVDIVLTRMNLDGQPVFQSLSAGLKRRVLLARALAGEPDILLLDEPTNHLDIDAIDWLEDFLLKYTGTLVFVTHDRMMARKLSTRIVELDRGRLTSWSCNYDTYVERKDALLDAERRQWEVFDKKLAQEEEWIRRGTKARRRRNEGRVNDLIEMRKERMDRREQSGSVHLRIMESFRSGKMVIAAEEVTFGYGEKTIVRDLNTLILRGDHIGIIGPNGCGKTTLIRLLLGELTPQHGTIRLGTNLEIAYYDQLRGQLDEEKTVMDNIAGGSDRILINGTTRHLIGYLEEFLFSPDRARTAVKLLSGGERNRLLLAKLFALPFNCLVMDEPTNDLDIETLELLEELLLNYSGTLLLVSHDRAFLNNIVSSALVFEDEAKVTEYIGGYDDWVLHRPKIKKEIKKAEPPAEKKTSAPERRTRKLSNKEKQELELLPQRIEAMESEQEELYRKIADPDFYRSDSNAVSRVNQRLEDLKNELASAYQRWEELDALTK